MAQLTYDFEKPIIDIEEELALLESNAMAAGSDLSAEISKLKEKRDDLIIDIHSKLSRWQKVQLARHPDRPYTLNYIEMMCDSFIELHGDRQYGDDAAMVTGLAEIDGQNMMIIGHQKGRGTRDNIKRNFGMSNPEGYRKALRVMKLGEKFNIPILSLVDTPGAFPGIGAEERGQAEAIAKNLLEMSKLRVPILVIIIGEGASGGALGIGIGDRILMMQNTWYSVISPEGCASILYRDSSKAPEAAEALKPTPEDLLELGIIDGIIEEPNGGAHRDKEGAGKSLKKAILTNIRELQKLPVNILIENRVNKYSTMGAWIEN
ncbi:acetyl-CoA carboxylase carboxyltransferase subunit alpha [Candidatus Marinimicrobia bacterium MT.SAG.4]|nr:acetyl-CoA carboxylase carboxyltransferase subunit alpha [Candidatus Marinimicrobia bacterium MT.SAG.4]